jgi:hypothetical protein
MDREGVWSCKSLLSTNVTVRQATNKIRFTAASALPTDPLSAVQRARKDLRTRTHSKFASSTAATRMCPTRRA